MIFELIFSPFYNQLNGLARRGHAEYGRDKNGRSEAAGTVEF
jgi:hypothetical protein